MKLIEVPDLNIFTQGKDIIDALDMARDLICLYGVTAEANGEEITPRSEIYDIDINKGKFNDEGKSIVTLIDIDLITYRKLLDNKSVRRNVTLPNWLNVEADNANLNVSKVLQEALMEKLQIKK